MIVGMTGLIVVVMLALIHFKLEEIKVELRHKNTLQEERSKLIREKSKAMNQKQTNQKKATRQVKCGEHSNQRRRGKKVRTLYEGNRR